MASFSPPSPGPSSVFFPSHRSYSTSSNTSSTSSTSLEDKDKFGGSDHSTSYSSMSDEDEDEDEYDYITGCTIPSYQAKESKLICPEPPISIIISSPSRTALESSSSPTFGYLPGKLRHLVSRVPVDSPSPSFSSSPPPFFARRVPHGTSSSTSPMSHAAHTPSSLRPQTSSNTLSSDVIVPKSTSRLATGQPLSPFPNRFNGSVSPSSIKLPGGGGRGGGEGGNSGSSLRTNLARKRADSLKWSRYASMESMTMELDLSPDELRRV